MSVTSTPPAHRGVDQRRVVVVGAGLIGGSVAMGLRAAGWFVAMADLDPQQSAKAVEMGMADMAIDWPPYGEATAYRADLGVVAVPAGSVAETCSLLLEAGCAVVTDVASTKASIASTVRAAHFVPGHPMAGSEQHGLAGSRADMFVGATWLLTPTDHTSSEALSEVHGLVRTLGAEALTVSAAEHDEMVAMVSHVPHLTAVTLMGIAAERADSQSLLLRLAAGGFRDMTRIAAGHPAIWPDICIENGAAIDRGLAALIEQLETTRALIASGDRNRLLERLRTAQEARVNLPSQASSAPVELAEVRVRLGDTPGQLARMTAIASTLQVNILDIEMAHSVEGPWGMAILVVDAQLSQSFAAELVEDGFVVTVNHLTLTSDQTGTAAAEQPGPSTEDTQK